METECHNTVLDCIRQRQSVRIYADRPVPENLIQAVIYAGTEAPTAQGIQPWRFIVVRDQALMKRISDFCRSVLLRDLDALLPGEAGAGYRKMLADPGFHVLYHAPVLLLVIGDERDPEYRTDCTLAAGTMLLAAQSLGLGGCWLGAIKVVEEDRELMEHLRVPEHFRIVAPLVFGYPAPGQPRKLSRKEPVVTWIA